MTYLRGGRSVFASREKSWFEKTGELVRTGGFPARIVERGGAAISAVGTQVSPAGFSFIVRNAIARSDLDMRIVLRERPINVRVKIEASDVIDLKNERWNRHYCKFTGIAADDWDLVVRYVKDLPEPAATERAATDDNEFRVLPVDVQQQIVETLVRMKRMLPPERGVQPLLRFRSLGIKATEDGRSINRIMVESRIPSDDGTRRFESRFGVWSTGEVELSD